MKRAKTMLNASKLMLAVALLLCAAWELPSYPLPQAANAEATPSQEVLVPLARGALGQPMNDKPELAPDEIIPVVAERWTVRDESELWRASLDAKLIAAGLALVLVGLFARNVARAHQRKRQPMAAFTVTSEKARAPHI